ncbi:tolloid-like protein 2 [Dendroctonus ponderosae]|uniref:tolloid-like protein 2 n=1 Tax=Dendroctonus ponderosae TaxID=77166 RepID=UPI002035E0B8|nr:tolloid-like protein 2 [Dendroctonus ponderosae]XP_048520408.1 tolloid-like protein 2 [Dendroctonus ponderosae]
MASDNRHTSKGRLILSIFCLQAIFFQFTIGCHQTFVSRLGGPMNGNFTSPEFSNPRGLTISCVYTFLGGPGQRVQITFDTFRLRGSPPDGAAVGDLPTCVHEYMDIYSEVTQPELNELVHSPFGGRYCGPIPPRSRVSLYRALAFSFHSDKNISIPDLFAGRYSFINDSEYEVGTPAGVGPCNFLVKGAVKHTGNIVSPTYPGAYPKNLSCSYQFLGAPGERIRLEFRDFDLFYGGQHCPFDFVRIYDGPDNSSAIIGTYCGQQRNLVIYSSESTLYVTFVTLRRTANTQNRGFRGIFEFSNSFTKLDFISKNDGEHIRGTECDQRIFSKKESDGFVYSPNYPFPYMPKLVCRYFIYGMQNAQYLERVRLNFTMLDIPKGSKGDCSDGYLKIYLKGQETMDAYDKFDQELCGDEADPNIMVSDGPRLLMVFSSGEIMGRGFKANYTFETEYRIPGTAAPDGTCSFTYRSTSKKKGDFNSPRYPTNYPSSTNCTYHFLATDNEQVTLVFDNFKIRADNINSSVGSYGAEICQEDWLEIYNVYRDGSEIIIGRYCHMSAPGPIESNRGAIGLKAILHSDDAQVASGFKARYSFELAKSIFGDCGANVSSSDSGQILSPNFPKNYDAPKLTQSSKSCNWYITVRPQYRVLIIFDKFAIEGEPSGRGCPAAVLRLWTDIAAPGKELCGEKATTDKWEYISATNQMRLSFITADKAVGYAGFRAYWTEVLAGPSCDEFQCELSLFCIPFHLKCNNIPNCGTDDDSDEKNCHPVEEPQTPFRMSWVVIMGAILLALICLCVIYQKKRRIRRERERAMRRSIHIPIAIPGTSRQQVPHFCDELGERFASVDSV